MYAKVAPIRRMPSSISELDYLVDEKKIPDLRVGHLVHIPFRNRLIFGVVTKIVKENSSISKKIKHIEKIFLKEEAIPELQLNFLKEVSEKMSSFTILEEIERIKHRFDAKQQEIESIKNKTNELIKELHNIDLIKIKHTIKEKINSFFNVELDLD